MLSNFLQKVKQGAVGSKTDLFTALIIFLIGMSGFGLGRLSAVWPDKQPIRIMNPAEGEARQGRQESGIMNQGKGKSGDSPEITSTKDESASLLNTSKGKYVASKSGTAYHFPWCPGALRIKEENKVWFDTKEEAEKRGYKPAGNCQGL